MTTLTFFSVKGGEGCTTVATLYALQLAMGNNPVHLSTSGEAQVSDVHAILGLTGDQALPGPFTIGPFPSDDPDVINVVDRGLVDPFGRNSLHLDVPAILVIRNTYLSLARWSRANLRPPDAVVLVEEPKRPLDVTDVHEVIGGTQATEVFQVTDKLARLTDAGILSYGRLPHMFHHLDRLAGVRR